MVNINKLNAGNMTLATISSEPHWQVRLPDVEYVNLYGQKTNASNENLRINGHPAKGYLTYIPSEDPEMGEPNVWKY